MCSHRGSHDPIFRTNKESSIWCQDDHKDMKNLSASVFQEECRMKIEHVLFPSVFFKIMDPCIGRSFSMCSHDPIFGTNKNRILKNGSCEMGLNTNFINIGSSSRGTPKGSIVVFCVIRELLIQPCFTCTLPKND